MPSENSCNYWVFREGRHSAAGEAVRTGLVASLAAPLRAGRDGLIDSLLRAGELETALADCESRDAGAAAAITNGVAAALVGLTDDAGLRSLSLLSQQLAVPERLEISTAEGFAYYALHPLDFAKLAETIPAAGRAVAVVGIRSIGATLSAVVMAALARRKLRAQRITVRPEGHPYDRITRFTSAQLLWIAAHRSLDAEFLVVDEGPGLSGSSFLSVGDALLQAGVERGRIRFLCAHEPDAEALTAPNAAARWGAYRSSCVNGPSIRPAASQIDCSGGQWRKCLYSDQREWPASWISMERMKFLSSDGKRLFKFSGYGRFGTTVAERARVLAETGFGPAFLGDQDGFAEYEMLHGRPACKRDLSRELLERIAAYCAMRASEFRVAARDEPSLTAMARFNYEQLTGEAAPDWLHLEGGSTAVLCDGRMQPHEWVVEDGRAARKTDGETHGDDHFFPGPCDIAWDLAGAIIEWQMPDDAAEALLGRYAALTGDSAHKRIAAYVPAYAAFRAAYCRMAAFALRGTSEHERLREAAAEYERGLRSASHSGIPTLSTSL